MKALGIDLGGTKIAAQIFADDWSVVDARRVATPTDYTNLIYEMRDLIRWADAVAGNVLPVGIGAAGLVSPTSGLVLAANLVASGKPFPVDIAKAVGRPVTYLNDCRALALSESIFGAGKGHQTVVSMVLGTGVSAGITVAGQLLSGPSQTGGEIGHTPLSAPLIAQYNLPLIPCNCGNIGCVETLVSGPGLTRIGQITMGQDLSAQAIVAARGTDEGAAKAWDIWCALVSDVIVTLTRTIDPDLVVLGGGLSNIENVTVDLQRSSRSAQWSGFTVPQIVLAQGGATSGAKGAAYAAVIAQKGGS